MNITILGIIYYLVFISILLLMSLWVANKVDKFYIKQIKKHNKKTALNKTETLKFDHVSELFDCLSETNKKRTILQRLESLWYRYFWNWITDLKWKIPNWWQRGLRGWGYADTWGLDYYLANVIKDSVTYLKKHKNGYPSTLSPLTGKYSYDMKRWDGILTKIIKTFETELKIINHEIVYISSTKFSKKWFIEETKRWKDFNKKWAKVSSIKPMTLKQITDYEEGWKLFQEYFQNLWD